MREITSEEVKKWKKDLAKVGVHSRKTSFGLPQGHIGNGIYRIADGVLCGKQGWDYYLNELKKQVNESNESKPDSN